MVATEHEKCAMCGGECFLHYAELCCDNPDPHESILCSDKCLETFCQQRKVFTRKAKKSARRMPPVIKRKIEALGSDKLSSVFLCDCFAYIYVDRQTPTTRASGSDSDAFAVDEELSCSSTFGDIRTSPCTSTPSTEAPATPTRLNYEKFRDRTGWKLGDRDVCNKLLIDAFCQDTSERKPLHELVEERVVWNLLDAACDVSEHVRREKMLGGESPPKSACYKFLVHLLAIMPQEFVLLARSKAGQELQSELAHIVFYLVEAKGNALKCAATRCSIEARPIREVAREFHRHLSRQSMVLTETEKLVAEYFRWQDRSFDDPREIVTLLPEEGWIRSCDPKSREYWWSRGGEWFYERATPDWTWYDAGEGRIWWQHVSEARWFIHTQKR